MNIPDDKKTASGDLKNVKVFKDVGTFFGSGIQLAGAVVIMFFVGKWIDTQLNSAPWGMIISLFFGSGAGLYLFIKDVLNYSNNEEKMRK